MALSSPLMNLLNSWNGTESSTFDLPLTTPLPLNQRLSQFLFTYHASPQATTNMSPSELFLGQPLRTRFDLLRPNSQSRVILKQADQKTHHDRHCKLHCFTQGQTGMV